MDNDIKSTAAVAPSPRQIAWQRMEFYAFVHFGMNTFTNREWGTGREDPVLFNPSAFNARQWVDAVKSAGMTGLIFTCKHHDGFCLWPSRLTEHSVKASPWRGGEGDAVREVADACREGGIRFGVYLSPWDRHDARYGDSPAYNRYFIGQLTELLTEYGPVSTVWLDGACGEGPNGQRQAYDWEGIYETVRRLQPDAVISVCGPDVRWCGNEAGHCRASEWSVVPASLRDAEKTQEKSQQADDRAFSRRILSTDEDLGSREAIRDAAELAWYPAEVNTSIRPGWFHHPEEDCAVRSAHELFDIYCASVGGNATFLLNVPPDRRGLLHEADTARLAELGSMIRGAFGYDLAQGGFAEASDAAAGHPAQNVLDGRRELYWRPEEGTERAEVTVILDVPRTFSAVILQEHIECGQRVEEFVLDFIEGGVWRECYHGTVIGYKKICRFPAVMSDAVRLRILSSRWYPTLERISVCEPHPFAY